MGSGMGLIILGDMAHMALAHFFQFVLAHVSQLFFPCFQLQLSACLVQLSQQL